MTQTKYQPAEIEPKWQSRWTEDDLASAHDTDPRPKYYNLVMLPYPSGDLHIGHWYNYTGADAYGRFTRMRGYNVMQPIGFDAFGLPAENAAIKRNIQPRSWTLDNIANMRGQLARMGAAWDWSREVVSCLPDYYTWTQWIFLQFYKPGQAYRTKAPANWCPNCNTTLANEQVVNGVCERCGTTVERREMDQWLMRITDYADELLRFDGLDWPEKTRLMQTNWIGRSEGAEIRFRARIPIAGNSARKKRKSAESATPATATSEKSAESATAFAATSATSPAVKSAESATATSVSAVKMAKSAESATSATALPVKSAESATAYEQVEIPVFTTRPDTIYGVTFFVLAPEHPLVERLTAPEQREAVQAYIEQTRRETEIERLSTEKDRKKTGVPLGTTVINPVTGTPVPVWIADYVLMSYGSGAVMGVPAHDQRDFEFARTFGLPIIEVIRPEDEPASDASTWDAAKTAKGIMVNSGAFDGTPAASASDTVIAWCEKHGVGKRAVTYRLRDWLISRQRYWGAPIPIVYCPEHGAVPVPEDQLPVMLPDEVQFKPTGESPLRYVPEFLHTTCPICGGPATRETDTMDTFICSSWYFLRYADPQNAHAAWDAKKIAHWLPVDMYIGGAEHATMHLLYARYFVKALRDMGLLAMSEPFTRLYHQGTVLGPDGVKMSKSRGNVIAPDAVVGEYGADAVRCYLMFMGPFDQGGPWNSQSIEGVRRYLHRVWSLVADYNAANNGKNGNREREGGDAIERLRHKTIARLTEDYANLRFNTALAGLMEYVNGLNDARVQSPDLLHDPRFSAAIETLLILLAPLAPHITEELWHQCGHNESIHLQSWPDYDRTLTMDEIVTLIVQVNGKVRDKLEVAAAMDADTVRTLVLASPKVQAAIEGSPLKKFIYVADRHLANLVI
ncbi:MAG: Leucyl-tRNA synthetase [Ktedonobacterales bacterium]|jgi:leucyl-tRNA synthetase|nr:MAG: Leucyl-tRNA synthetase [Ktedonobacterales bacterium]